MGNQKGSMIKVKEPSADDVTKTLMQIAAYASRCVQLDYRRKLGVKELQLITAVYVNRAFQLLSGSEYEWDLDGEENSLCLKNPPVSLPE